MSQLRVKENRTKQAGPSREITAFLLLRFRRRKRMLGKPCPEARQLRQEAGFEFLQRLSDRFGRVVADKVAPAREHVHPDVSVEDHVPPPGRGEDGGRGGARLAERLETGLHGFPARIDGESHSPRGAFLFQQGRRRQQNGFLQPGQR